MSHNPTAPSGRRPRPLGWFALYIAAVAALAVLALAATADHTVRARAESPANPQSDVIVPLTTPTAIRSLTPTITHTPTSTASPTGSTSSPSPTVSCGPAWRVVSSPNEGGDSNYNTLLGVAAVSPTDIWAVGGHDAIFGFGRREARPDGGLEVTLAQHWDGTKWTTVTTTDPPNSFNNYLVDVAAFTSDDVWAVGYYGPYPAQRTLIEHWDGTAWSIVTSPNPAAGNEPVRLLGMSALAPNDIWAVGTVGLSGNYSRQTLVEHWDGIQWSIVASPSPGPANNGLQGVYARAANDVWAVGYTGGTPLQPLILHWDGATWSSRPAPGGSGNLFSVAALASNNVWAVGTDLAGTEAHTLVLHYDGIAWATVASPGVSGQSNTLNSVVAVAPNNIWAVGNSFYFVGGNFTQRTVIEHYDGSAWSIVDSPSPGTNYNYLSDVIALSPGDIWAVGGWDSPPMATRTHVQHYSDPCAESVTPTTTATSTATITHTATLTATPILCAITFTDVLPTDYFYTAVQYLYCRDIISGYADGTFRPYNSTTRGQLAKIVVLAEGFPINTTGGPHFTDVPTTNPFYAFIETAYNRGLVSGYADGTFRWGNNVTRGQLSKIIVIAEGFPINTTGGPQFTDVPTTNPFYLYIETAYNHSIISGYSDDTFRPNNNATRGQISKIVYTAATGP